MILDRTMLVAVLNPYPTSNDKEKYVTFSGFGAGGNTSPYVKMNIQPASLQILALGEGEMFKTFTGFTRASGIVETMRLTTSGTTQQYYVRGRQAYDYGVETHYEVMLEKGGV